MALTKYTVLLVEDVAVNRQVAAAFLTKQGHTVVEAVSGSEALRLLEVMEFDAILLDIRLPDMDGVDVARAVRQHPQKRKAQVPILALTANVFPDDIKRYRAVGMNGVIAKPIQLDQFRRAVTSVLPAGKQTCTPLVHAQAAPEGRQHEVGGSVEGADRQVGFSESGLLDRGFIAERLTTLGSATFLSILHLGLRGVRSAAQEVDLCCSKGDPVTLGQAAHRLAGAASNFGFAALFSFAQTVEQMTENPLTHDQARGKAAESLDLCTRTEDAVAAWLNEQGLGS